MSDDLNRRVDEYRSVSRTHGFDAALSLYAGEPVVARVRTSCECPTDEHPCPYAEEMRGEPDDPCTCCEQCEQECIEAI